MSWEPPYVWELPYDVTFEEAEQHYRRSVEWGLWGLDPGGFVAVSGDEERWFAQPEQQPHTRVEACVPVPCPSFTEFDPAAEMNASGYQGSPEWQREAWAHFNGIQRELLVKGEAVELCAPAVCQQEHAHSPTLRWVHLTVDDCIDGVERYALAIDPAPQVDLERALSEEAARAPRAMMPKWAGPSRPWLASTDDAPLFVMLPDGVQEQRLAEAIALCQRAGLLPDTPHGVVYLPEGTEMP